MRRRLPGGLRWRLLVALVVTSAMTLGATALVVLPPLQSRLRDQSADSLRTQVDSVAAPRISAEMGKLDHQRRPRGDYPAALGTLIADLNVDARLMVMDDTTLPGEQADGGGPAFLYDSGFGIPPRRAIPVALAAMYRPQTAMDGDDLLVAAPLYDRNGKLTGSLVAERQLSDVATLVEQVRTRFVIAALVGLLVAVLLATALSSTLLRRLGRLRSAALRITEEGPDTRMPSDPHRDEVGDLARALALMQEELRRQEAARRAFVSTASHELRTPLTMLQGTMELLEEDLRDGRLDELDALRQIDNARKQLVRLSTLAGELLDLSRLDAAVPLRSEPVELGELARAVAAEFELRARERSTTVEVIPPDGPCWGRGDPDAVARVVRILLDNALRYGPRGAPVRVRARLAGGSALIAVSDSGPGIPEAERDRIFERFHRGSGAGGAGGFGLGLAIGRELARRMGGELDVEDGGAHETRFALTLRGARSPADDPRSEPDRVSA
jgi:signal transduction histidine kinase